MSGAGLRKRGGLAGAGPLERPVLCRAQAPEGHRLTPGVSVWLGLCSAAALPDTRPTPAHGSQVGPPLPSLPAKCCGCPHTSPRGQDPSDSVLAWPGSTIALLLAQGKQRPNRGQTSTSSSKGQGWTKRGPRSSCPAPDRSPHGEPFQSPGQCAHRGLGFSLACPRRADWDSPRPSFGHKEAERFSLEAPGFCPLCLGCLLAPQLGSGSGGGGPRPLGSSRTQGPVQPQAGHRHRGPRAPSSSSKQKNLSVGELPRLVTCRLDTG